MIELLPGSNISDPRIRDAIVTINFGGGQHWDQFGGSLEGHFSNYGVTVSGVAVFELPPEQPARGLTGPLISNPVGPNGDVTYNYGWVAVKPGNLTDREIQAVITEEVLHNSSYVTAIAEQRTDYLAAQLGITDPGQLETLAHVVADFTVDEQVFNSYGLTVNTYQFQSLETFQQYVELYAQQRGTGLTPEQIAALAEAFYNNALGATTQPRFSGGNPAIEQCFLEDSTVQMWPLDPSIKPRLDGSYDEELVLSKVWYKRQDQMQAGDFVVSYDKQGRLQPGRVTRTMTNTATHILDFWGTGVTPGHVYNCADGPFKGGFAPLMDVLRMDGALMRSDGTMYRSTTNCEVGSIGDRMIHAEASAQNPDGTWTPKRRGQIRFGTRISTLDGKKSVSVMEIAERQGWSLSDDGYMVGKIEGADSTVQESKFPFPYTHGAELPKPEDYILTRSQVTLEEIYLANEWEQISTRMPAPDSLAGFNPNSSMKRTTPKPNIPPAFANRPDAPTAKNRAQRSAVLSR